MRKKENALILTFATTAQAMKTEKFCEEHKLPGRLIPVPSQITAGCGLAWKAQPQEQTALLQAMEAGSITWEGVHILERYV